MTPLFDLIQLSSKDFTDACFPKLESVELQHLKTQVYALANYRGRQFCVVEASDSTLILDLTRLIQSSLADDPLAKALQSFRKIIQEGIILSSTEVLQHFHTLVAQAETIKVPLQEVTTLALLTMNRPEILPTCLASYSHNIETFHPGKVNLYIFDDSSESVAQQNKNLATQEKEKKVYYVGSQEKAQFIQFILDHYPFHSPIAALTLPQALYTLLGDHNHRSYGCNRNFVLLYLAGQRLVMVDDDSLPQVSHLNQTIPVNFLSYFNHINSNHLSCARYFGHDDVDSLSQFELELMGESLFLPTPGTLQVNLFPEKSSYVSGMCMCFPTTPIFGPGIFTQHRMEDLLFGINSQDFFDNAPILMNFQMKHQRHPANRSSFIQRLKNEMESSILVAVYRELIHYLGTQEMERFGIGLYHLCKTSRIHIPKAWATQIATLAKHAKYYIHNLITTYKAHDPSYQTLLAEIHQDPFFESSVETLHGYLEQVVQQFMQQYAVSCMVFPSLHAYLANDSGNKPWLSL